MKKLLIVLMVIGLWINIPHFHIAPLTASAQTACGQPVWTASPGAGIEAGPLNSELLHLEACSGQATSPPFATPSPVGSGCVSVAGSFPYTIGCVLPQVSASPGLTLTTNVGPPIVYGLSLNLGNCLGLVTGQAAYTCSTPGPQATPSNSPGTCANNSGTWPYTVNVDLTCSPTWTGESIFDPSADGATAIIPFPTASPSPCPGPTTAGATPPQGELCIGPNGGGTAASTTTGGIVLGKALSTAKWGDGVLSNSQPIQFCRDNGTNDACSDMYITGAGVFNIPGTTVTMGNISGTGTIKGEAGSNSTTTQSFVPEVYTQSGGTVTSTYHGSQFSCTFSAATTCTSSAWTGAAVFVTPQGCDLASSSTGVQFTVTTVTTTQVSLLASTSNSQTVTGVCWGV